MDSIFHHIASLEQQGGRGVLVTIVQGSGHIPAPVASRMLVTEQGDSLGTVGGGVLEQAARTTADQVLHSGQPLLQEFDLESEDGEDPGRQPTGMLCGGRATLFFEPVGCRERALLFGAGHVGQALWPLLQQLGFHVTVLDTRAQFMEGMSCATHTLPDYGLEADFCASLDGTWLVIATHSHEEDYRLLHALWNHGATPRYVAMLASRRKAAQLRQRLARDLGRDPDLSCLYSPAGLRTGGKSPAAVALSLAAEMQALRTGISGHLHMGAP